MKIIRLNSGTIIYIIKIAIVGVVAVVYDIFIINQSIDAHPLALYLMLLLILMLLNNIQSGWLINGSD